jgi:hypothetical protein
MKNLILMAVATLTFLIIGCEKNSPKETVDTLAGTWKEFQYLADPGDGSGIWQNGNGLIITINKDLTYNTNKENSFWGKSGNIADITDSTFSVRYDDTRSQVTLPYKLKDGVLEIHYLCIEPCGSRFKKIIF